MYILGLNAYHGDSSAAILVDGKLVAAAEEERFCRTKHWAGFPSEAIRFCLTEAGIGLEQLDAVAINQNSRANLWRKVVYTLARRPDLKFVLDKIRNRRDREGLPEKLGKLFAQPRYTGKVYTVEHHLAHLSSAFHVSPFEEAVIVSVDGFGDFASGAWGVGRGADIVVDQRVYFPHSLGNFYQALTQFLGFPYFGDEYKVMGLAPYGKPAYLSEMQQLVQLKNDGGYRLNLHYFRHHRENVVYKWEDGAPVFGQIYSDRLLELLGPAREPGSGLTQRHRDIARSVQDIYEAAFFHLLNTLHRHYGIDQLALAGGCAMNSVANGKIYRNTPFRDVYIQSAAGDAGGAIGAAFTVWHDLHMDTGRTFVMEHAYWGPQYDNSKIEALLAQRSTELDPKEFSIERVADTNSLCRRTAEAIAAGNVIGWFQGRMEWGPRALGNRSILGDPRRADMKDILHKKIKRRESFRPFAPSILREAVSDWFEEDDDVPFMMKVFQIREDKRGQIPAVTHVDGSGRLQTVTMNSNPHFYRLIEAFQDLTGVPVLLNTSFNENEPVVCRPEEALDCFLRTRMDVLVLGDYLISRQDAAE
ncbi:MAG: carbamoyltransferase [Proteobacteria bacterium]|nr:carbamoyltransferase [Pseudomonadota bacterium]